MYLNLSARYSTGQASRNCVYQLITVTAGTFISRSVPIDVRFILFFGLKTLTCLFFVYGAFDRKLDTFVFIYT